jgi:hypothetical protein
MPNSPWPQARSVHPTAVGESMVNVQGGCPGFVEFLARDGIRQTDGTGKLVKECVARKVALMTGLK